MMPKFNRGLLLTFFLGTILDCVCSNNEPGLTLTLSETFFQAFKDDVMNVFEEQINTLQMPDSTSHYDVGLGVISLTLEDQKMNQFELDKNESTISIVDKSDQGEESYLVIEVKNMTLNFDMKFDLHSVPEWFRDKGTGFIKIQNFNISLHLMPFTRHGKVQFHFKDAVIEIEDFYA